MASLESDPSSRRPAGALRRALEAAEAAQTAAAARRRRRRREKRGAASSTAGGKDGARDVLVVGAPSGDAPSGGGGGGKVGESRARRSTFRLSVGSPWHAGLSTRQAQAMGGAYSSAAAAAAAAAASGVELTAVAGSNGATGRTNGGDSYMLPMM